jgi:streptogramin lyase
MSPSRVRSWIPGLALCIAAATAACAGPADSPSSAADTPERSPRVSASTEATPVPSASANETIEARADVIIGEIEGEADWPLEGFGSLWMLAPDQEVPSLLRLDPSTNEMVASIELPGRSCQGFTVSDDAVWACTPDGAARIDPETNEVTGTVAFETGMAKGRLAFGAGSVWALGARDGVSNQLVRIDPVAMTTTSIALGHGAASLAYGFDAVWVTAPQDGMILRVDPDSEEVTQQATELARPQTIVTGPDSLWVTLYGGEDIDPALPTVLRIDPGDGAVLAEVATGAASEDLGGIWATEDAVWVRAPQQFLTRIDPSTNEVVEVIEGPTGAGDVTVAFGSVWATSGHALDVYRFAP